MTARFQDQSLSAAAIIGGSARCENGAMHLSEDAMTDEKILAGLYRAAMFVKKHCDTDGWVWRTNCVREIARAMGVKFSNTRSPALYRKLRAMHPELKPYLDVNKGKNITRVSSNGQKATGL
jgi:hypothetical protein